VEKLTPFDEILR